MFAIFARVLDTATRRPDWDPPDYWRNPPAPRSADAARARHGRWLRRQFGRSGLL